jgi:hypothetical protein
VQEASKLAEQCAKNKSLYVTSGCLPKHTVLMRVRVMLMELYQQRCVTELARVRSLQGDAFPAVFERVKVALRLWSTLPNDPRLSGDWDMAPDRGVTDQIIAACGPPFKVIWWRVLKQLGRIPRRPNDIPNPDPNSSLALQ